VYSSSPREGFHSKSNSRWGDLHTWDGDTGPHPFRFAPVMYLYTISPLINDGLRVFCLEKSPLQQPFRNFLAT